MANRKCLQQATYLLSIKQQKEERLKNYLTHFNREWLTVEDQDEKITVAALLGGIWTESLFIVELAKKMPLTLKEFKDKVGDFVNSKNTLQALINPQGVNRRKMERETCKYSEERSRQE